MTSFERVEPWDRSPLPLLAAWFEDEEASAGTKGRDISVGNGSVTR
ncbi:hypothetical protein [Paenibacillus thiaminolyticus]|nr:hypothetical protein [Paenibacillus thiaminolyticus]